MDFSDLPMSELERVSRAELLQYLEEVSGRRIRTHADIDKYVEDVNAARKEDASTRRWRIAKQAVLLVLAFAAALQYYLLDIMLQIASLPHVTFFVS